MDYYELNPITMRQLVRHPYIRIALLDNDETPNCWNILQHAKRQIDLIRDEYGNTVCVFKIGITADPAYRFHWYRRENFEPMTLIHVSSSHHLTGMLESALIQSYNGIRGCRNIHLGGDGSMHRSPPPYYAYIVAARADRGIPIGS